MTDPHVAGIVKGLMIMVWIFVGMNVLALVLKAISDALPRGVAKNRVDWIITGRGEWR